jgi:uncharacterized iron-regulated membrane protein
LRSWSAWTHTWLGLTAGLLFCLLSISGAIIVFRPQIEDPWGPKATSPGVCTGSADADEAARIVKEYSPGSRIERITFPADSQGSWRFQIADAHEGVRRLAYDPCSQKVLGVTNIRWVDWMVDLHHNLLAGKTGRQVVGAIGIGLLLISLSGLIVWLVSNPRWRTALQINRSGSFRRMVFDVHRSAGLAAMLVILVQSVTGIWLSYPKTLRNSLSWFVSVGSSQKAAKKATKEKDKAHGHGGEAKISALILAASRALPDGKLYELRLPDAGGKSVQARMWRAGDVRAIGNNIITLNTSNATVISIDRFADQPPAQKAIESITPIHYGEWGGLGARILLGAAGLVPPVLLISGFLIWWLPKRIRARKAAVLPSEQTAVPVLR